MYGLLYRPGYRGPLLFLSGAAVGVVATRLLSGGNAADKRDDHEEDGDEEMLLQLTCTASRSSEKAAAPPRFVVPRNRNFGAALTELDLGGCGLAALPDDFGERLPSLRKLNAAKNALSSLPASFAGLLQLRIAFFLGCDFETVPSVLGRLPRLFMLSFKANKLSAIPEDALSPSIGWLILSDNRLERLPASIGRLGGLR